MIRYPLNIFVVTFGLWMFWYVLLMIWLFYSVAASADTIDERMEQQFCEQIIARLDRIDSNYECDYAPISWEAGLNLSDNNGIVPVRLADSNLDLTTPIKQILMLSPKWSSAYDVTTATIIEQFARRGIKAEFIMYNYLGKQTNAKAMLKNAEYHGTDLIFSVGSATTALMSEVYHQGLIPVVSACSKDPVSIGQVDAEIGMSESNIAYTSLNIDVATQVSYLKEKFLTNLQQIAVIYDQNNPSSIITQVKPLVEYLSQNETGIGVRLIEVEFSNLESTLYRPMREAVASSKEVGDTIFLVTGSTEIFNIIRDINNEAEQVPVLSVTPSHVKEGEQSVFVAIGVSFKTNAKLAADYAYRILKGEAHTATLPVGVVSTPDISINFLRKPARHLRVPITFFEDSVFIYNYQGKAVRKNGENVRPVH